MISKHEILTKSQHLPVATVEKDYVIGLLLTGIANHPILGKSWIFKGGTCLKKCYFKNYRFSEDLDFTLTKEASTDVKDLQGYFKEITTFLWEEFGLFIEQVVFDIFPDKGGLFIQAKVPFKGPVSQRGSLPKIKLDLSKDEVLVDLPVSKKIFHEYSDRSEVEREIFCYSFEEIFAEKFRALIERTRPRDLYDVVHLYEAFQAEHESFPKLKTFLEAKFGYKNLSFTAESIALSERALALVKEDWEHMLAHQLENLPPVQEYIDKLNSIRTWILSRS